MYELRNVSIIRSLENMQSNKLCHFWAVSNGSNSLALGSSQVDSVSSIHPFILHYTNAHSHASFGLNVSAVILDFIGR